MDEICCVEDDLCMADFFAYRENLYIAEMMKIID